MRIFIRLCPALLYFLIISFISFPINPINTFAVTSLSVHPLSGGTSLRFGRVEAKTSPFNTKEMRIRVIANEGVQYQVFQRVAEPLINEKGTPLNVAALTSYAVIGSNASGSLYQQDNTPLGFTDQLLYTSNANGDSDSFTVVYTINPDRIDSSGNFSGRIIYLLRPLASGSPQDVSLNIFLEVRNDFKVERQTSSGMEAIKLFSDEISYRKGAYLKLFYSGNMGEKINIYQEVLEFPRDQTGEEVNPAVVSFFTPQGEKGTSFFPNQTPFDTKRVLLYSSSTAEDVVVVNFLMNPEGLAQQTAGNYKGRLRYVIERESSEKNVDVDLELAIQPAFKIEMKFPPGGVSYPNLLPDAPPQDKEVEVYVKSNLGRPYMVTQNVNALLTNEKGEQMPPEVWQVKGELVEPAMGKIIGTDFNPVTAGESPVFVSDNKGSSARFKMIYRLRPSPRTAAGNYTASVMYSLGEI